MMQFKVGDLSLGKVLEIHPNGALIGLAEGEAGFLHLTEIAEEPVGRVEDYLTEGQQVLVKVIGYDRLGRPSLSLRRVTDRDREAAEFHREAIEFRSVLANRSISVPLPERPEERLEWRLSRWLDEAEAALARLRKHRAGRLSEKFYTD
ncbi:S1 RNA-binding domain-containing protein [Candidatus Bipolaricaulota bacterium]|nr:S1 RNA-binding domain-containing protein [Candidatus Bipolaricaulota bacterium]